MMRRSAGWITRGWMTGVALVVVFFVAGSLSVERMMADTFEDGTSEITEPFGLFVPSENNKAYTLEGVDGVARLHSGKQPVGSEQGKRATVISDTTLTGMFNIHAVIAHDAQYTTSAFIKTYHLTTTGENETTYTLEHVEGLSGAGDGDEVRISGATLMENVSKKDGEGLILQGGYLEVLSAHKTQEQDNFGGKRYALIYVGFNNLSHQSIDTTLVWEAFLGEENSANANIREVSRDSTWITGRFFTNDGQGFLLDRPAPLTRFEASSFNISKAVIEAVDPHLDLSGFFGLVYIYPENLDAAFSGLGTPLATDFTIDEGIFAFHHIYINGNTRAGREFTATHEVGHNFRVGHENARVYPEGIYSGPPLIHKEYGGIGFMAASLYHPPAAFVQHMFPGVIQVPVIRDPGTYQFDLAAIADTAASRLHYVQGVEVARDDTSSWFIDFREDVDMDEGLSSRWDGAPGVNVYLDGPVSDVDQIRRTYLPQLDDMADDYFMKPGEEFVDAERGLRVKVIGENAQGLMQVEVELRGGAPNILLNKRDLNWPTSATRHHAEILTYTLVNNSSTVIHEPFQVSLYERLNDGSWQAVTGQSHTIATLSAGQMMQNTFSWLPQEAGSYDLRVVADNLNHFEELSTFDNSTPAGPDGHRVEVVFNTPVEAAPSFSDFAIHPAYPNPFTATTTLAYDLPQSAPVRLVVYDLYGRKRATLVEAVQAPGQYEVTFEAGNLASGVYFYRLEAGSLTATRHMVLTK